MLHETDLTSSSSKVTPSPSNPALYTEVYNAGATPCSKLVKTVKRLSDLAPPLHDLILDIWPYRGIEVCCSGAVAAWHTT